MTKLHPKCWSNWNPRKRTDRHRGNARSMIIIGIDTAIRKTGYGVLETAGAPGSLHILDCGVISNSPKLPHSECLRRIAGGIHELVEKFRPDAAAIEGAFAGKNIRTAMILSLARGAVITKLAEHGIPVYEYSPRTAKRAATGRGDAPKEQVAALLAAIGHLDVARIPDDSTDALALALCHGSLAAKSGAGLPLPQPI